MPAKIDPLSHYYPVPESGCWLWAGKVHPAGYGIYAGKLAHRLSYAHHNGPIPAGALICHKCDTRLCINPAHLFAGSHADNHDDMRSKRRQAFGVKHGMARLTQRQVNEIRIKLTAGESQSKLAREYGVSQPQISHINTGRAWYGGKYAKGAA